MRRLRGVVLLLAALAAGACEDVVDPDGVRGTYDLVAVDGRSLPAVAFDSITEFGHLTATAVSGSMTLREISYTQRVVFDLALDGNALGEEPAIVHGEYSIDGQLLTFEPERADHPDFSGTLQGSTLTTTEVDPQFGQLTLTWQR